MAVSIRLAKFGKKNAPTYRVVAIPQRSARNGRSLEVLGYFNPSNKAKPLSLNKERITYWQKEGALVTAAVSRLLTGSYVHHPYRPEANKTKS